MQIVSLGDNLHEVSDSIFYESKKNIINLLYAESTRSMESEGSWTVIDFKCHM